MNRKYIYILTVVLLLTYSRWISFRVFTWGDWWYFFSESMSEFRHVTVWNTIFNMGAIDVTLWRQPVLNLPFGLFGQWGLSQEVAEKFIIFWPTIILGNFGIYFILKRQFKSSVSGFVGTVVFNYNSYYLGTTHILIYTAGVWGVFTLFCFIEVLKKHSISLAILTAILMSITGFYDLRVLYMLCFILFSFCLYYSIFLTSTAKGGVKKLLPSVSLLLLVILLFLLFNLFWIMPMVSAKSLVENSILKRGLFGNSFLNIKYTLTLYYPFWDGTRTTPFITHRVPPLYWLIPTLACTGMLLNRKSRIVFFFGIVALLGIFLTKQVAAPFTNLYPFLFNNIPGYSAFREATKYYFFIILGYSILIGSCVSW